MLVFHEHIGDIPVCDGILCQPDIQQPFGKIAVDALFGLIPHGYIEAALHREQHGKQPRAVLIEDVAAHDEHVEAVPASLTHDLIKAQEIVRAELIDDFAGEHYALAVVGVNILLIVGFDIVAALFGKEHIAVGEQLICPAARKYFIEFGAEQPAAEMAAVMREPDVVGAQISPRPVHRRKFAIAAVLFRYVIARIVALHTFERFAVRQRRADVHGEINCVIRHAVLFVGGDHYLYIFHKFYRHLAPSRFMTEIMALKNIFASNSMEQLST